MRYLKGTLDYSILFPHPKEKGELYLVAYSDLDWCGDKVERRSTSGYVFLLYGAPISWNSKKKFVVALSTCEAEYISACSVACQALWILSFISELNLKTDDFVELHTDNKSALT